jgi:sialate O-acetylesterase
MLWYQGESNSQELPRVKEYGELLSSVHDGGMTVCSDIGFKDDIHPTDKKTVGERLSRRALNKTHKKNIIPSGPYP